MFWLTLRGARSLLAVPLLVKDDAVCRRNHDLSSGGGALLRKANCGCLQNFAAQAVIAMDNARLLDADPPAPGRVARHLRQYGRRRRHVRCRPAAGRLEPQFPGDCSICPTRSSPSARPYADYLRYLAERGEFGADDIEAELGRAPDEYRPGTAPLSARGRTAACIEVRRNPVPGGGFVLIYSDITERKRAEAEIRAARDAAERGARAI